LVKSIALATQIRCLGILFIVWISVRGVGVGRPAHIKATFDFSFSHAIALDIFFILGA
jgi:hypothetical protein